MERFSLVGERLKCSSHPLINQVALASKSCMRIGSTHKDQFCEQVPPSAIPTLVSEPGRPISVGVFAERTLLLGTYAIIG